MMKTAPPAPFIITKAEFLLELLVVAFDAPPQLCQIDQTIEGGVFGQGGKPILGRLGFVSRPLDQKPLFSAQFAQQVIAMPHGSSPWAKGPRPHSAPGKARGEPIRGSLAPSDRLPCLLRQAEGEGLDRDRLVPSACNRVCGRPRPVRDCGGMGASPGGHTDVLGPIPAT